jgi:hypothetical protein
MQNKFLNAQDGSTCSNHILYGDKERTGGFLYKWLNNFGATQKFESFGQLNDFRIIRTTLLPLGNLFGNLKAQCHLHRLKILEKEKC